MLFYYTLIIGNVECIMIDTSLTMFFLCFSTQIRSALKKKAFEDAGISPQTAVALQAQQNTAQTGASSGGGSMLGGRDVTLNMLNASESEVDVEGMGGVGMDFEGANEVVTS